ncbi:uncharacterized protein LOC132055322 isoform X2 [Lycium ferocissimum]|uniref:uncharacterized protein LOC132055322 isoform X2 n=1 Tax=Lycium ferocissimum TaxID=112874 RepID=UPI00281603C4|nr:uncharacterized protein LOC132055322 isoform X2 [Lycium ferocissimum]
MLLHPKFPTRLANQPYTEGRMHAAGGPPVTVSASNWPAPRVGRRYLTIGCWTSLTSNSENHHYSRRSQQYWDKFYKLHNNKFFKDRHYLEKDWRSYFDDEIESSNGKVVLEVGCGAGNTIFPLVTTFPKLYIHACDFSPKAITLVKIFTLSAVSPSKMASILENCKQVLKPNGHILLRDYAIGDSAQVKLHDRNQMISENFYFRGDGTCSFYFSEAYASTLFGRAGFAIVDINTYCKEITNHSRNITMQRRWIRAIFSRS